MPKTSRTWKGARSPSGLKRVRQTKRRSTVLQPRRSAAKSLVAKALRAATQPIAGADPKAVLLQAISALDRAAKSGAIHGNAAARRKSRLTKRLNAATGQATSHAVKSTSRAQAAKAARARIAAAKADKSKGTQTAAEKARAALTRTTRADAPAAAPTRSRTAAKPTAKTTTRTSAAKSTSTRKPASGAKPTTAKTTARKTPKS